MRALSLCNHLQRRGSSGNYYFRVRIPSDLLEAYAPKKELAFSLKTKDPKEAKARCRVEAVRIDQEFGEHRRRLKHEQELVACSATSRQKDPAPALPLTDLDSIPDYELDRLAVLYLHEVLAHDEQERAAGGTEEARKEWEENQEFLQQLHEQKGIPFTPEPFPAHGAGLSPSTIQRKRERARLFLQAGGSYLASGDTSIIHDRALAFLGAHGLKVEDKNSLPFQRLCLSLIQREMEAQEAILKRLDGLWIPTPPASQSVAYNGSHSAAAGLVVGAPVVLQVNGQGQAVQALAQDASLIPSDDNPCLSTIWESYLKERKPAPSTIKNFEGAVRRFIELVGDLPVNAVTKSHFRQYKDALLKFPVRLQHSIRKMTIQQIVAYVEKEQEKGNAFELLNSKTINNKYLGALKAILAHAVDNGFINDNPANQIRVTHDADKHGDNEPATLPYTDEDLNVLFSSSFFVPGQECKFKKRMKRDAVLDYHWLPIVALFTGARLEEIGQLDVADVMEEDGVKFLFIHADQSTDRRLKNKSSRRKVPIHPRLMELGFLEFVALRRKQRAVKLFSTLKEMGGARKDKRTDAFSKWWRRYTEEIGVKPIGKSGKQKTFHSFRHTSKRALRNAGVDPSLTDAIHGHTNKSISAHYGRDKDGMGYALPVLLEAISKARMENVLIQKFIRE
jgi:integrase